MKVELIKYTSDPVEHCAKVVGITTDKEEKEDCDKFIRKIVKMGHLGVLEHAVFCFRVEGISRALTHQWVRHRMGSFLQKSQRRVDESKPNYMLPPLDYLPNKNWVDQLRRYMMSKIEEMFEAYRYLKAQGVKLEDARFVLPNACETQMYWTVNGRALRHFFMLRLHKSAQWEIREMAKRMFELVCFYQCKLAKQEKDKYPNKFFDEHEISNHFKDHDEDKYLIKPVARPFFKDLIRLYNNGEYSGEGRLE